MSREALKRDQVSLRAKQIVHDLFNVYRPEEQWAIVQKALDEERADAIADCVEIIDDDGVIDDV